MKYFIYELICRACGETITKRMDQFDSLPSCSVCDSEMLVENVTTVDHPQNENEVKTNG